METTGIILVVDDEEIVRNVASAILETQGYRVLTAENPEEAITLMGKYRAEICLALVDARMRRQAGESFVSLMLAGNPDLAVVVCGGGPPEEALRYFGAGHVAAFLQKPYTAFRLWDAVSRALRTNRVAA